MVSPDQQSDDMFVAPSVFYQSDKPFPINSQEYDFSRIRLSKLIHTRQEFMRYLESRIIHLPEIEELRIYIKCSLSEFEKLKTEKVCLVMSYMCRTKPVIFASMLLRQFTDKRTTIGVCPGFTANGREVGVRGSIITGYMNLGTEELEIHICHAAENDLYDMILKKFKKR